MNVDAGMMFETILQRQTNRVAKAERNVANQIKRDGVPGACALHLERDRERLAALHQLRLQIIELERAGDFLVQTQGTPGALRRWARAKLAMKGETP